MVQCISNSISQLKSYTQSLFMEASIILTLNRPKSRNYLIPTAKSRQTRRPLGDLNLEQSEIPLIRELFPNSSGPIHPGPNRPTHPKSRSQKDPFRANSCKFVVNKLTAEPNLMPFMRKTNPISKTQKPTQHYLPQRFTRKTPSGSPKKTNPNKPNPPT